MAKWMRLQLAGGKFEGKEMVKAAAYSLRALLIPRQLAHAAASFRSCRRAQYELSTVGIALPPIVSEAKKLLRREIALDKDIR